MSLVRSRLGQYLLGVGLTGGLLLAAILAKGWPVGGWTSKHLIIVAFLIAAESMPIRVAGHEDEVTTSAAFSFTLLCTLGLPAAAAAQAVACLVADLRSSRSAVSALFNVGQYTISLLAAAGTLTALSDFPRFLSREPLTAVELAALAAAGAVFFAVNNVLAGAAYAIAARRSVIRHLRQDLAFQAATAALVLGCAPLVITVLHDEALLLPFLLVPVIAVFRASQEARRSQHMALHDRLTGLPNRTLFRSAGKSAIALARRHERCVGVLVMDLDRFKEINDTLGHHSGDLLLGEVAQRLAGVLRKDEVMARFGGDEFAVLLPDMRAPADAEDAAHRLLAALSDPVAVESLMLRVECSVGVACFPEDGENIDELVRRADIAMYVAKSRKLSVQRYSPGDDDTNVDRLALAGDLRDAIALDQFVLFYQPVMDVTSGTLAGAEALVRWVHPERGLIAPDEFIATAETTGAIRGLTSSALHMAVAQSARWREEGLDIPVSVNVSAQDLLDERLPDEIASLLRRYDVPPRTLRLELTESMLMADPERAHDVLSRLDAMGVRIAIDDFGTGYSSLAYLAKLPVEQLKIDRAFIRDIKQRNNTVIVASTIELARQLGLRTVAEGVEDRDVLAALAAQRCDLAQGYHFSRPLPAREFTAWARAHQGLRPAA